MNWSDALAEMEGRLALAEQVLLAGGRPPPELGLPEGLGPIPPELLGRAARVKLETDRMIARVVEARSRVVSAMVRHPEPSSGPSVYVDTRA